MLVTPVYKEGDKHGSSNYNPVSFLVGCCKLKHIVFNQVLEENNLITTLQHGSGGSGSGGGGGVVLGGGGGWGRAVGGWGGGGGGGGSQFRDPAGPHVW